MFKELKIVRRNSAAAVPSCQEFLSVLRSSPATAQSYETLLSNLHLVESGAPIKSLLITSAQPGEGKTTVTVSLALTMVLAGRKVLLVDADWRKPAIHQVLRLDNARGFIDVISGPLPIDQLIQPVEITANGRRRCETLGVITSGQVPSSAFDPSGFSKLREALDHLASRYDAILLDSPPSLSVSDPLLLAPLVDGIILVLSAGSVTEKDAQRAKRRLEEAGGRILGVVMNRFDEKQHGPGFHPYHGYYDRGSTPRVNE